MTTKDMLQILIKGQEALRRDYDILLNGQNALQTNYDTLLNGQNSLKQELAVLREEMRDGFRKTHERLDKQGKQIAYLDDDAPTREEHDGVVKRVEKLEKIVCS